MTSKPPRKSNGKAPPGAARAATDGVHNEIAASYYSAALFIKEIVDGAHVADDTRARTEALAKLARLSVQGLASLVAFSKGTIERDMLAAETLTDAGIMFFEVGPQRESKTLRVAAARLQGRDDARGDAEKIVQVARLAKHALALPKATARGNAEQLCQGIAALGGQPPNAAAVQRLLEACAEHSAPKKPRLSGVVAKLCLEARLLKRRPSLAAEKKAAAYVAKVLNRAGISDKPELWVRPDGSIPYVSRAFGVEALSFAQLPRRSAVR